MNTLLSDPKQLSSQRPQETRLLTEVSIIVPVGPGESLWRRLLSCLARLPIESEIQFVAADSAPDDFQQFVAECGTECSVNWTTTSVGRSIQMNVGAKRSTRKFLWFLHADSLVQLDAVVALDKAIRDSPEAIHFFDLYFSSEKLPLTKLNSWGVWFRSHCLGLPFGDQGLCMSQQNFERLEGFNEDVAYGEDHLLVWAAHRQRVPLRSVGCTIETSSRKYERGGWLRTTAVHLWRTWYQAMPQWIALVRSRLR